MLEVLAGTHSALGASHIARLTARGSRVGQAPILERLAAHGIVDAEPANQGFLYRLNRDHVLAPAILAAAGARGELIRRLTATVEGFIPAPAHASVFGSFARGEAGEDSDIDLLLIANDPDGVTAWDAQIEQLGSDVRRWTGNRGQILAFSVDRIRELAAEGEPVVSNWLADGLVLAGDPLSSVLPPASKRARRTVARS